MEDNIREGEEKENKYTAPSRLLLPIVIIHVLFSPNRNIVVPNLLFRSRIFI